MALSYKGPNAASSSNSPQVPPFPFENHFQSVNAQMDTYEDPDLLDIALSHIPLQELHITAERIQASNTPLACFEDALAEALVKWFKPNFMVWIDPILCSTCQSKMEVRRVEGPRDGEEKDGQAGRVEIHVCVKERCPGENFRFPRYNTLAAIMKFRKGRCGEFANLFTLFLRAVGLRARYLFNAEDHVWNEYYSPGLNRWVHLDSCENARDEHHIYSVGWGKKMSLVVAFSVDGGAIDVTQAYVPPGEKWNEALEMRKTKFTEGGLASSLKRITESRRFGRSDEELQQLSKEDERDRTWWQSDQTSEEKGEEDVGGRKSGTEEWKAARGEDGS